MATLKIELYSDIVCPWCIIGQHRLDKVLRERFPGLDVDVEHHPYELQPHAPPEGLNLGEYFGQKGITDMTQAFARPEREARISGLYLDLARQRYVYRTIDAHTLLRSARGRGTQHALAAALMDAFFREQRNISDADTLIDIASRFGFLPKEVWALLSDAAERKKTEAEIARTRNAGVTSVPTFRIGAATIVGGRSEDEIAALIDRALHAVLGP